MAGTKDADSVIWHDAVPIVDAGSARWSNRTPIRTGLSTVSLVARDAAGNESPATELRFLCDMLTPRVVSTTPADGAVIGGQPAIRVSCSDRASGPDLPGSLLQVKHAGAPVAGAWTFPSENEAAFASEAPMADGTYEIDVALRDRAGMVAAPYVAVFEIDTPVPAEAPYPVWWSESGVFAAAQEATNDYAALNAGQLKWMAHGAALAFGELLPFGSGAAVDAMVDGFVNTQNYHAVNVGQLKDVATPFYDWLGLAFPWEGEGETNDWALANVGQLKQCFDLRLSRNGDDDTLPDWWEVLHF